MTDTAYPFSELTLQQFADLALEIDSARETLVTDGSLYAAMVRGAFAEIADRIESLVATARELQAGAPESAPEPVPAGESRGARHVHVCSHRAAADNPDAPRYLVKADDGSGVLLCAACALATVTAWHLPVQPQDTTTLACPHALERTPIRSYSVSRWHTLLLCNDCATGLHTQLHEHEIGIAPPQMEMGEA